MIDIDIWFYKEYIVRIASYKAIIDKDRTKVVNEFKLFGKLKNYGNKLMVLRV